MVAILGILAAIAAPRLAGAKQSSANASAMASLRNLANAFELYHEQHGAWPVPAADGSTPPGMSEFLPDQLWARPPALGERWVWINDPVLGVGVGMGVAVAGDWRPLWREFDLRADDGVLATGLIQAWASSPPALVWIIEDGPSAVGGVAPVGGGNMGGGPPGAIDGG